MSENKLPQVRLNELLALSDTELDRLAAECQGWDEFWPGSSFAVYGKSKDDEECVLVRNWLPSTDIKQAWELAEWKTGELPNYWCTLNTAGLYEFHYQRIMEGDWAPETFTAIIRRDAHSPSRILTAFGILARETTPK